MMRSMNAMSLYMIRERDPSTYGRSQSYFQFSIRAPAALKSKISGPMLSEHSSGCAACAPSRRASSDIVALPPVEMLMTASVASLIRGRNAMKCSADGTGAAIDGIARMQMQDRRAGLGGFDAGLCDLSGVTGRYGDIDGVWIEPVGAQVIMTFRVFSVSWVRSLDLFLYPCMRYGAAALV